jgi:3'(2'), 5'-bisphosphate nucleotidase
MAPEPPAHPDREAAARLAGALEIARAAGRSILELVAPYGAAGCAALELPSKPDQSLLTRADLAAHDAIVAALARRWPGAVVVSEEDLASHGAPAPGTPYWLVDPLDGTREFLAGRADYTVNLAYVEAGVARLGVVLAPALGLAYWGGAGLGAWRERAATVEAIACAAVPAVPRIVASRSHLNAETTDFISRIGPHELVQAGSSLKFCRVAEGTADLYPRLGPTCEWDTAAAQAVLEGAGGHVWTLDGRPLGYGKPQWRNPHFVASAQAPQLVLAGR